MEAENEEKLIKGTIIFTTLGALHYGFDIFSLKIPSSSHHHLYQGDDEEEHRVTDGVSINFNGQFVANGGDDDDDDFPAIVYVSERSGSPRIYLSRRATATGFAESQLQLPSPPQSLFLDRPLLQNGRLYFISAHEPPDKPFKSWSALYAAPLLHDNEEPPLVRLTPYGCVDYSPAISPSGKLIAVASYGSRTWGGEFRDLLTDIVVFPDSDPAKRTIVCQHGGWPTWSGDSTIYFHRQADDGWWSVFRVDLPEDLGISGTMPTAPTRVTPPGLHCLTPAAMHDESRIAVATRRRDKKFRHIEIYDLQSQKFWPVTELLNPNFHHYNPFVSSDSGFLGYHRFRGESAPGDSIIPHISYVTSPIKQLRMVRLNGAFPSFSPNGDLVAFNQDFDSNSGLRIVKSDGSKRWTLLKERIAFCNSWSPTEENVIFTSLGPIFDSIKASVQIGRISFDSSDLSDDREDIPVDVKILTREDTGNNAFPSCSPDGKYIVFRSGRSGHKNLYIIDAVNGEFEKSGGMIRQLTEGPWIDTMPSWSPDGKLIAFSSNRHNPDNIEAFSIYVIHPESGGVRRIEVEGWESGELNRERINHVCFSPDGEWLLLTANIGGVTSEPVAMPNQFQPYGDLYAVKLDGSGLQRLTCNGYENGSPAWHQPQGQRGEGAAAGDKLRGEFDEPLWLRCDV
ncbi:uncharacterized protein LOC127796686 [Diospyros lotus]|uniref:uncharacterized protein LOC127796686 n=1 Tax=Diospyros lotus TaxID=55363 RepID=UPI00225357B2|nr:uncharacterized protein LOC127796686 [Diospyros lotus]